MAANGWRRSGFSRRAQLRAFASLILSVIAIFVGAILFARSVYGNDDASGFRGAVLDITAPVANILGAPFRFVQSTSKDISDYLNTVSKNRKLETQLKIALPELARIRALELENERLKKLLDLAEPNPRLIATARVVSGTPASPLGTAVVAAGRHNGVTIGQPVREPAGLVGRIIETGSSASRILLLTHVDSRVPVAMVRDGTPALVTGRNEPLLEVKTVITDRNPFRVGDLLITSGAGGIYPPDIPVAIVVRPTADGALARPATTFERLTHVIIEDAFIPKVQPVRQINKTEPARP